MDLSSAQQDTNEHEVQGQQEELAHLNDIQLNCNKTRAKEDSHGSCKHPNANNDHQDTPSFGRLDMHQEGDDEKDDLEEVHCRQIEPNRDAEVSDDVCIFSKLKKSEAMQEAGEFEICCFDIGAINIKVGEIGFIETGVIHADVSLLNVLLYRHS